MRISDFDEKAPVCTLEALASLALRALRNRGELRTVKCMCLGELAIIKDIEKEKDAA